MLLALLFQSSAQARLVESFQQFSNLLVAYAIALVIIGALTMAIVEGWKKLWDARTKFHAARVHAWIKRMSPESSAESTQALAHLLQLCTGVSSKDAANAASNLDRSNGRIPWNSVYDPVPAHSLFTLDTARMMGAIQEAADSVLTAPKKHQALFATLTDGADVGDVGMWFDDAESVGVDDPSVSPNRKLMKDQAERAARLRQAIKRKLDAFQLVTTGRWAFLNQLGAILIGDALMLAALLYMRAGGGGEWNYALIIPLTLTGGVLAPVIKDLTGVIDRVKGG